MEILIQATQLILSLSILVILHELGHFIPAKLFKTRVEKFYLFFDPWFSLFKFKKGDTEYGVGWLPLGGYVKISGMIDESMDKEQMKEAPKDWEFRSKPAWQRLIIMLGGVTVNVILGFIIYSAVLFTWGDSYIPNDSLKNGIYADSTAQSLGFKTGDKILTVNDKKIERFSDVQKKILTSDRRDVKVLREDKEILVSLQSSDIKGVISKRTPLFFIQRPPIVDLIIANEPAYKAGLLKGDIILKVNNYTITAFQDVQLQVQKYKGQTIDLLIDRNGNEMTISPKVSSEGFIGFAAPSQRSQVEMKKETYGFFESIPAGVNKTFTSLTDYIDQMKMIGDTETGAYKSLGGFLTIGSAFSTTWDWERFWSFTAMLSIILAIMNLLPIPALDGGHVMFLVYEIITGRKPHEKVMEYAQIAGIIILLGLMVLANGNDVLRLFQ